MNKRKVLFGSLLLIAGFVTMVASAYNGCPVVSPLCTGPVPSNPFNYSVCSGCLSFYEPYFVIGILVLTIGIVLSLYGYFFRKPTIMMDPSAKVNGSS
jgi:uncharacterized membrane protein